METCHGTTASKFINVIKSMSNNYIVLVIGYMIYKYDMVRFVSNLPSNYHTFIDIKNII